MLSFNAAYGSHLIWSPPTYHHYPGQCAPKIVAFVQWFLVSVIFSKGDNSTIKMGKNEKTIYLKNLLLFLFVRLRSWCDSFYKSRNICYILYTLNSSFLDSSFSIWHWLLKSRKYLKIYNHDTNFCIFSNVSEKVKTWSKCSYFIYLFSLCL